MKKLSLISLISFILVLSCSDDSNSPNNNADELIPLKIGNTWVHDITYYDDFLGENSGKVTSTIVSEEMHNGEKYYRMEHLNHNDNKKEILPFYLINKSDGFYLISIEDKIEPETDIIKYPVKEGEIIRSDEFSKSYIEKVDTLISTRAGKFKCIKFVDLILFDGQENGQIISYFCPGVGQIAIEDYKINYETGNQYIVFKSELISYILK
jgi:hypothetical protein